MNETWVTLTGRVGSVQVKDLTAGGRLVTLRVATTPRRLVEGEWRDGATVWLTVKAWRTLAEHVAGTVRTGDAVLVHGRLVAEEWTGQDGTLRSANLVVATSLGLDLARPRTHGEEGTFSPPVPESAELPRDADRAEVAA